jgi:uncharacterized protein YndB with AHSA1/START domain
MTRSLPSVTIVRRIKATPAKVYAALTEPTIHGGTELTLIHEHLPDEDARTSHEAGWSGFLDKLHFFLGDPE